MYHKYNTEGVVIKSYEKGESSRNVVLFSEEFGLIYASVQNARGTYSKLKPGAQDFAFGNWKMVGAQIGKNFFYSLESRPKYLVVAKVFSLITELSGEEKNAELYEIVVEFLNTLESSDPTDVDMLERLTVIKVLKNHGVVAESEEEIALLLQDKRKSIEIINKALRAGLHATH